MKIKKQKNKFDKYFLLSGKKLFLMFVIGLVSILLHNAVYAIFNYEDFVFFIIVVFILPSYFIISCVYTFIRMIKEKSIFEKEFAFRAIIAIILGTIASYLVIKMTFINEPAFWILEVIFLFMAYYLIKFLFKYFQK